MYQAAKKLLFALPPETAHQITFALLESTAPLPQWVAAALFGAPDPRLAFTLAGLPFAGPIGLAAGLDKNGTLGQFWPSLGFGFIELGTVTAQAQPGNPKPRLFRFPQERALINRMGFNNDGSYWLAERLKGWKRGRTFPSVPVGVNLGKSKITPLPMAAEDYALSARRVAPVADYLVINVSSPNTPGLRTLQDKEALRDIISAVKQEAPLRPIFVKLSPDLTNEALEDAANVAEEERIAGLIATNTTIERFGLPDVGPGGLSGEPLRARSLTVVRHLAAHTTLPIIAVGGLSSIDCVCAMLSVGASAVQIYTGLIFEGPSLISKINRGLLSMMKREGLQSYKELKSFLRAR